MFASEQFETKYRVRVLLGHPITIIISYHAKHVPILMPQMPPNKDNIVYTLHR